MNMKNNDENQQGKGADSPQTKQSNRKILENKYLPYFTFIALAAIVSFAIMFCCSVILFDEKCVYIIFTIIMGCIFALASCFVVYFLGRVIVADINNRGD